MADPARRKATWADLLATPEGDGNVYEIIGGEIQASPRPRSVHARATRVFSRFIGGHFDDETEGPDGWWILPEVDVLLAEHECFVPDIAGLRRARVPEFPDEQPIRAVPDWTCEVLSRRTWRVDRQHKADVYLAAGVPFYWIVDLDQRLVEAFEARGGFWVRLGAWSDDAPARIPPFDEIEIDLKKAFPPT
ncbi:MAG: Uma2 family endonuclease [Myxococcota bacterium]